MNIWIVCILTLFTSVVSSVREDGGAAIVPTFAVNELLSGRRYDEFAAALETTGLIALHPGSSGFSSNRERAFQGMCNCHDRFLTIEGTERMTMNDKSVLRSTLATATVGTTPLPLPHELTTVCGSDVANAMESIRDDVSIATDAFVVALDRLLGGGNFELMHDEYNHAYTTVSSIQASAKNLEHFHIYHKKGQAQVNHKEIIDWAIADDTNKDKTLFWHTDAGLFLTFVPALDCEDPNSPDKSFWVDGQPVDFPSDSVIIMLGAGAEHWLQTLVPLRATRHAVRMEPGQTRVWYGMMTLVPEYAIVQEKPQRTFRDMQTAILSLVTSNTDKQMHQEDNSFVSIGCGAIPETANSDYSLPRVPPRRHRRRLQHADPSHCNNKTNFFCWMSCLDIPNHESVEEYLDEGYSLYCLDPSILASSGNSVSKAVENCAPGVHNSKCLGKWNPTSPLIPGYDLQFNSTHELEEQFCYGGTSMYMDGFHWTDSVCVIYLFPEWILSSRAKLVVACLMTFFFATLLEFVIFKRRWTVNGIKAGIRRRVASALFYGTQLTMGYFLMLVVMTYSGPLFMSTVLGLVCGHVLFNAKDAIFGMSKAFNKAEPFVSSTSKNLVSSSDEEVVERQDDEDVDVPEGITPCCQNDL